MSDTAVDRVPVLDLQPELDELWDELAGAAERVLRSGRFIGGPEVHSFEQEAAAYLGVPHAVGVNSGTDALVIGLRAAGVEAGDEVLTSPFTFFASPESIGIVGADEGFVDVDPDTFNLDPERIEETIGPRTRAIMPVHLFGRPLDMERLTEIAHRYDLLVIEDCAQSFGARWNGRQTGSFGDVGAYSFFPSKNLGGFGDGGLLVTGDAEIAERARKLRAHGGLDKYRNEMLGYNSRLDSLQAALLRVKLPHIDRRNAGRRAAARRYGELLADAPAVTTPEVVDGHVFHQYTIRVADGRRDAVREALAAEGVATMIYYPIPCHRLPVYEERDISMPNAERLADEVLSLPIWPTIGTEVQERVAGVIRETLGS